MNATRIDEILKREHRTMVYDVAILLALLGTLLFLLVSW